MDTIWPPGSSSSRTLLYTNLQPKPGPSPAAAAGFATLPVFLHQTAQAAQSFLELLWLNLVITHLFSYFST